MLAEETEFVRFQQSFDHLDARNDSTKNNYNKIPKASVIRERFFPPSPDFSECDHDDADHLCCYG